MQDIREIFERHQVGIYFAAVVLAALVALLVPGTAALEGGVNPALALMLFVTFLQVPLADLGRAFSRGRFLAALLITNFIVTPLLVAVLVQFLPSDPMVRLGVLLVLLTPCIDYVVTFSHLGRADARLLLAATPALLVVQMLLLPVYLGLLLGNDAATLVQPGPFVHAFVWLIAVPLALAGLVQLWAARSLAGEKDLSGTWSIAGTSDRPCPIRRRRGRGAAARLRDRCGLGCDSLLYRLCCDRPLIGWSISRLFRLDAPAGRAIAFSAGTRNSLVVLPLALAVPGAIPVLPAIVVTQTLVELLSELVYVRFLARLGGIDPVASQTSS